MPSDHHIFIIDIMGLFSIVAVCFLQLMYIDRCMTSQIIVENPGRLQKFVNKQSKYLKQPAN